VKEKKMEEKGRTEAEIQWGDEQQN
jgi:hypothetical protein